jgi:predicted anti-sigma-YlaC factor YlaD
MNRCEVHLDELKAFVDGELPVLRRAAVRAHVSQCPACREEVKVMEQMSSELKAGDVAALPADLRDRLISAAPEGAVADAEPETPLWRRRPMQIWAGVAVATVIWFILYPVFSQTSWQARNMRLSADSKMKQVAFGGSGAPGVGGLEAYSKSYDESGVTMVQNARNATLPKAGEGSFMGVRSDHDVSKSKAIGGRAGDSSAAVHGGPVAANPQPTVAFANPTSTARASRPREVTLKDRAPTGGNTHASSLERDVKKTGELTVEVARLEVASDSVEGMVKESGGYVANNQLTTGEDGIKAASLDVRVPVNLFDAMLSKFSKLGEVKSKNVTGEDLTEQISDEKQAKRAMGDELEESKQKLQEAKSRKDKREADQEVRDLKVQIAQAEGRLELLKKQARLSTISISLREKSKVQPKPVTGGFIDDMKDSGREALASFTAAARVPFVLIVWALAYSPVWVPLAFGFRYAARAHQKKVEVKQWQARRTEEAKAV